jgi:hypothetical protein
MAGCKRPLPEIRRLHVNHDPYAGLPEVPSFEVTSDDVQDGQKLSRPLSEIRDGFWNTPRLPLLPDGDEDLRRAVFRAISEGKIRLVDKDGIERRATSPSEINLGSSGLRIAKAGETLGSQSVVVPDVVGLSGPVARVQLEAAGLWLSGDGDGAIATQVPAAGATRAGGG